MKYTNNNSKVYINRFGEPVMRVTQVIKVLNKDQLPAWANKIGLQGIKYQDELNRTSKIGTCCHDVLEAYFSRNRLAVLDYEEAGITSYNDKLEVRRALESFFSWYRSFTKIRPFNVLRTEQVVVGDYVGGTFDIILEGWDDPNKIIIGDYKTSSGFYLTQFLQLAAYTMIYEEVYGPDTVEGVMLIRMDKKGKKGEHRIIKRKNLEIYIDLFKVLQDVAMGMDVLKRVHWNVLEK